MNDPSLPPRQYVGLLTEVMNQSLDEDYTTRAARRGSGDTPRLGRGLTLFAVLTVFGLMAGVSAVQTAQDQPQELAERAGLVEQIHQGQDGLDDLQKQTSQLQDDVTSLQRQLADAVSNNQDLTLRLTSLGVASGALAVSGPGIEIIADDAPEAESGTGGVILDSDLQALVNGLWEAGAEAIAIDDHRLTSLTSIRFAGQAITVDYRSLSAPYTIVATGDPSTLPARLAETKGGQMWLGLKANFGVRFDTTVKEQVTVPADPRDHLLFAQPKQAR